MENAAGGYRPKIFIHAPYKPEPAQARVKQGILDKIRGMGFDPQEFHLSGTARGAPWTFDRAIEVMRKCDGALILALMRRMESDGRKKIPAPSEYSHFEGALALACNLPSLVIGRGRHADARNSLIGSRLVRYPRADAKCKTMAGEGSTRGHSRV